MMPIRRFAVLLVMLCAASTAWPVTSDSLVLENLLPYQIIEGHTPYTLAERMEHYHVPGVGIAVIKDFQVVWTGYYGVAEAGSDDAVSAETLFGVGSLSKAVTSACVLRLARSGAIDLDGAINRQLRSWQVPEHAWSKTSPVTPALLMNHSGGMPHRQPYVYPADGMPTAVQLVLGVEPSRNGPLMVTMEPGRSLQYSNGGCTVLQILVEDNSGQPFPKAADRLVFQPMGMSRATFANPLPVDRLKHAAWGHLTEGRRLSEDRVYMAHVAAGGLWTTAEDYARFIIGIQEAAAVRSDRVLNQALAQRMITPGPAPDRHRAVAAGAAAGRG